MALHPTMQTVVNAWRTMSSDELQVFGRARTVQDAADIRDWLSDLREYLDSKTTGGEYSTDRAAPAPDNAMRLLVEMERLFPHARND